MVDPGREGSVGGGLGGAAAGLGGGGGTRALPAPAPGRDGRDGGAGGFTRPGGGGGGGGTPGGGGTLVGGGLGGAGGIVRAEPALLGTGGGGGGGVVDELEPKEGSCRLAKLDLAPSPTFLSAGIPPEKIFPIPPPPPPPALAPVLAPVLVEAFARASPPTVRFVPGIFKLSTLFTAVLILFAAAIVDLLAAWTFFKLPMKPPPPPPLVTLPEDAGVERSFVVAFLRRAPAAMG